MEDFPVLAKVMAESTSGGSFVDEVRSLSPWEREQLFEELDIIVGELSEEPEEDEAELEEDEAEPEEPFA